MIIVDSSDHSQVQEIAANYGENVEYTWVEPDGVAAARNQGIDAATGDVIGFCDADDFWNQDKLSKQLPLLNDGYDIVYSDEYLIYDGAISYISSPPIDDYENHHIKYFREGGVGSRSVLTRKDVLDQERFDNRFSVREDPHLWTRIFADYTPARIGEPLSYKRKRSDSLTADRDQAFKMQLLEINDLVERYPELEPYREERELKAKLLYAKTLISDENRIGDARSVLLNLLKNKKITIRLLILLFISTLPIGNRWLLKYVQNNK
ncbi:family 2 glycosyl transferase [Natrialba aegyptia DSM 13077]|uniref:Family 2 glycosyl transferase n=1 Tax=Natrialba aegyptia DSM 13077 TaxID=1227491 RepID=M0AZE6_9EURY|nr:family 2 glycosyl transferase [Natrialba aegyptia DSM 13077]